MNLTLLAKYAVDLFRELEAETGQATGYKQTGGLWLAQNRDRLTELRRICAMGDRSGLDTEIISTRRLRVGSICCIPKIFAVACGLSRMGR